MSRQSKTAHVTGMNCASCSSRVEKTALSIEGVYKANVNLASEKISLGFDDNITNFEVIAAEISKAGYPIQLEIATASMVYRVEGMNCASCVSKVEGVIQGIPGVNSVSVNLATEKVKIEYLVAETRLRSIKESVEKRERINLNSSLFTITSHGYP